MVKDSTNFLQISRKKYSITEIFLLVTTASYFSQPCKDAIKGVFVDFILNLNSKRPFKYLAFLIVAKWILNSINQSKTLPMLRIGKPPLFVWVKALHPSQNVAVILGHFPVLKMKIGKPMPAIMILMVECIETF